MKKGHSRTQARYLLFSLTVHILILMIIVVSLKKEKPESDKPIPIELLVFGKSNNSHLGAKNDKKMNTASTRIKISDLAPRLNRNIENNSNGHLEQKKDPSVKADGYAVSDAMDIVVASRNNPFFSALWKKVNAVTDYPDDFVKARVTGSVSVHVEVDRRGVFTGNLVRVDSDNELLAAYATAMCIYALEAPLPERSWFEKERIVLVIQFNFKTYGPGELIIERKEEHLKNILAINRYGYVDPKLNQAINKFFTRYFPPIIPIPGGAYIDLVRTYEFINNIGTPDPDEMRQHRLENEKLKWQSVIKKK